MLPSLPFVRMFAQIDLHFSEAISDILCSYSAGVWIADVQESGPCQFKFQEANTSPPSCPCWFAWSCSMPSWRHSRALPWNWRTYLGTLRFFMQRSQKWSQFMRFCKAWGQKGKLEEATHYPADDGEKQQIAVPPVDLEKTQGEKMKETLQTPQTKCPEGHDLVPFESEEDDFLCSVCDCEFPMGTILYGCRSCDYDLCRECLAHTVFHASGKSFVTAFPEMQTTFQSYGTSNQSILQGAGKTCLILLPSWWESGLRWDPDMLNC